jgi:hypothetical protein
MPTIEARIPTDRPARYLHQFCNHAAAMGARRASGLPRPRGRRPIEPGGIGGTGGGPGGLHVHAEWSDTAGTVFFDPFGRCLLTAEQDTLVVRIESTNPVMLQRMQAIVTADFDRFGRNRLAVDWREVDTAEPESAE